MYKGQRNKRKKVDDEPYIVLKSKSRSIGVATDQLKRPKRKCTEKKRIDRPRRTIKPRNDGVQNEAKPVIKKHNIPKKGIAQIKIPKKQPMKAAKIVKDKDHFAKIQHKLVYKAKKIPRDKLERSLEILNDDKHVFWAERYHHCRIGMHRSTTDKEVAQSTKLKLMRQCLLRRDWLNMARVLRMWNFNGDRKNMATYAVTVKYASICLAHTDESLLDTWLGSIMPSLPAEDILKFCTSYAEENKAKEEEHVDQMTTSQ